MNLPILHVVDVQAGELTVQADERLSKVAAQVLRQDQPVRVLDQGEPVGLLMRDQLIDALYGKAS